MKEEFDIKMMKVSDLKPSSEMMGNVNISDDYDGLAAIIAGSKMRRYWDVDELASVIAEHGLIEPLRVLKYRGKYIVIDKKTRWEAILKSGIKEIPVLIGPGNWKYDERYWKLRVSPNGWEHLSNDFVYIQVKKSEDKILMWDSYENKTIEIVPVDKGTVDSCIESLKYFDGSIYLISDDEMDISRTLFKDNYPYVLYFEWKDITYNLDKVTADMDSFLRKNNLKIMNGVIWMIGDIKSSDAEYLEYELIPYEDEGYFDIQYMDVEGMPESVHMIVECQTGF